MTTTLIERPAHSETPSVELAQTLLYRLRRVQQRASAVFVDMIGDTQITPTQWAVLTTLKNNGALSQNQLGRLTFMDPATTQGVILRLVDRNLVERRPDPGDRRRTSVSLTKPGAAFVAQLADNSQRANERVMEPLSAVERETLLRLLEKLM